MNDQLPHDPNSLADELDRVLPPGQARQSAPSTDPLVEAAARLSSAPRPALSPEALVRIHAAMLSGQTASPAASRSLMRRFLRQSAPVRMAMAAVLLFVLATGVIFAAKIGVQLLTSPTATTTLLPPSATSLIPTPTATIARTATTMPIPPSPTMTHLVTQLPLGVPTIQPTTPVPNTLPTTASSTLTPTMIFPTATFTDSAEAATAEATTPVTIVVEGPIQSINGNTVIIFDLTIVLNATDLASVHVGDVVRVEGYYAADSQVIIAIRITVIRNTPIPKGDVETNPTTGQVWTDSGNCSNPPPPWAPANGWRRRCQGAASPGDSGGNGMGMGD